MCQQARPETAEAPWDAQLAYRRPRRDTGREPTLDKASTSLMAYSDQM